MRIISTTIVSHEIDILEAFVRHHGETFDRMIFVLKRSPPAARSILEALRKEGYPIDIRESREVTHWHPETHNTLLQELRSQGLPDWIIVLDCDEFLRPLDRSRPLHDVVATLPPALFRLPWQMYIPRPEDDATEPHVLRRIQYRRDREPVTFYKVLVPRAVLERRETVFGIGAHSFLQNQNGPTEPMQDTDALALAHFPIRSPAQAAAKAFTGWLSYASYPHKKPGDGFQWKELFDRCKDGGEISPEELQDLALRYAIPQSLHSVPVKLAHDPVPTSVSPLSFPVTTIAPLRALAESGEDLAQLVGTMQREYRE